MGAKQWFEYLREHLKDQYGFQFCSEQPCLARNEHGVMLIHVDDMLYVGKKSFWRDTFLRGMSDKFSISHSELSGIGSSVTFLRRKKKDH